MRVAMLSKLYPPWVGGLEAHVSQLAHAVSARHADVDVSVITGHEARAPASVERHDRVTVYRATTVGRIVRTPITLGTRALVQAARPHVIHVHSPNPWAELVAPLDDRGLRVVVTYHHDVVRQKRLFRLYAPILDRLLRRADRIIVWSPQMIDSPVLRGHADKIEVIPGGIETSRFLPTAESRQRARQLRETVAPRGPVVLFVGRLVYYKGVEFLIRAMRDVEATLLIVGQGEREPACRAMVGRLGLESRVRFLTNVSHEDLPLYYQASDLLVLPSSHSTETFGLVQVEAHASALPSICTALPTGVTFVNVHGVTGLVVPPRDATRLAAAMNQLLDDSRTREAMGRRAQQRAIDCFDIGRCADAMVRIYRQLTTPRVADAA